MDRCRDPGCVVVGAVADVAAAIADVIEVGAHDDYAIGAGGAFDRPKEVRAVTGGDGLLEAVRARGRHAAGLERGAQQRTRVVIPLGPFIAPVERVVGEPSGERLKG